MSAVVPKSGVVRLLFTGLKGLLCILILITFLASCALDPVTGRPALMLMSEEEEIRLGAVTDRDIRRQYGIYQDIELNRYIADVGQRLAALCHRPHLPYEFKVLDTPAVNAFAVPGGFVYMTRGILAHLNSEAELATVLGHEIGHITARHSAEQYSRAQLAQIGLAAGMIVSPTLARLGEVAQLGVQMLFLSFSRQNEREADDLAIEYASKAGYEAERMAAFFETLERMNPQGEKGGLPGWFSTHPNPEDRLGNVRKKAAEWRETIGPRKYLIGAEAFLKRIDGLIYGDDPREGYVEKGIFHHPVLRFQLPLPEKWRIGNMRDSLRITSPQNDAVLMLGISSVKSRHEAASIFVEKTGARIHSSEDQRLNGLNAHGLTCSIRTERGVLGLLAYFIEKDGRVYELIVFSGAEKFKAYAPLFESVMLGFRDLSDPKRIDVRPERIRVASVRNPGTMEQVLISLGIPRARIREISLLNGKDPEDMIRSETHIKIVER